MATDRIEMMAVEHLKLDLLKSEYVKPLINENDRTPSWDGAVLLYKSKKQPKEDMVGSLPIQVKGVSVDKFSKVCRHDFEWADLQNYFSDKGCLYVVVQVHRKTLEHRVYYKELPLLELKKLLDAHPKPRPHHTIAMPLKSFPTDVKMMESLLFTMVEDINKHLVIRGLKKIPSIAEYKGSKLVAEIAAFGAEGNDPLLLLTQNPIYFYRETPYGILPLLEGKLQVQVEGAQQLNVTVDGETYYDEVTIKYKDGKRSCLIGDSLEFSVEGNVLSYRAHLSNSLKQRIADLQFLLAAVEREFFKIEDFTFNLSELASNEALIRQWHEHFQALISIQQLFEKLGVEEDLQLDKVTIEEDEELATIIRLVLYDQLYFTDDRLEQFFVNPIGNLNILIACSGEEYEEGKFRYQFMSPKARPLVLAEGDRRGQEVSLITFAAHRSPEQLSEISNLGWKQQVEEYERLYPSSPEFQLKMATEDMVIMLMRYDETKKEKLLDYALKVCDWLLPKCKERLGVEDVHMAIINHLQILLRYRPLTNSEKSELAQVIGETDQKYIKYVAFLLLGDMANAKYNYEQLEPKLQDLLDKQPISRFKNF